MKAEEINILVACEKSQAVCIELRKRGFNAFSNDIQECSGNYPEWHLKMDVFEAIGLRQWNMMIAFPPCTNLAVSGAAWFEKKRKDGSQQKSIQFFLDIANADIPFIALENPVGIMSTHFRKPSQIIQPYQFGDPVKKTTCLWLKGLPKLKPTNVVEPEITTLKTGAKFSTWDYKISMNHKERAELRSVTFLGIAKAIAQQYGDFLLNSLNQQQP